MDGGVFTKNRICLEGPRMEEEEEKEEQYCSVCKVLLEPDEKVRKRKKKRKCAACLKKHACEAIAADPVKLLLTRWKTHVKRYYPSFYTALCSHNVVSFTWERWYRKCVITREKNPELLCVYLYPRVYTPNHPGPTQDDLVIITTKKAHELNKVRLRIVGDDGDDKINAMVLFFPFIIREIMRIDGNAADILAAQKQYSSEHGNDEQPLPDDAAETRSNHPEKKQCI